MASYKGPMMIDLTPKQPRPDSQRTMAEMEVFGRLLHATKCIILLGGLVKWFMVHRATVTGLYIEKRDANAYIVRALVDGYTEGFTPTSFRITFRSAHGVGYITLGTDTPFTFDPEKGYVIGEGVTTRFYLDIQRKELLRHDFASGERTTRLARIDGSGAPVEL